MEDRLAHVKHIVLVLSGKGGVGKSTVATSLALQLNSNGWKVGILDIDLCGPSVPHILGLQGNTIHQASDGWVPVYLNEGKSLSVMSIGFLLASKTDAVVWRGPKKNAMIKQFLTDVCWDPLDYLIIDTPPGTSDEHISIVECLRSYSSVGAVLVTTPQAVSIGDVRRELGFCTKAHLDVIGIIENMSGFTCPHCKECSYLFSTGGGEALAQYAKVPFLGRLPIDPNLTECMERGTNFLELYKTSDTCVAWRDIVTKITDSVECKSPVASLHD